MQEPEIFSMLSFSMVIEQLSWSLPYVSSVSQATSQTRFGGRSCWPVMSSEDSSRVLKAWQFVSGRVRSSDGRLYPDALGLFHVQTCIDLSSTTHYYQYS